jgi:hypothetical protein
LLFSITAWNTALGSLSVIAAAYRAEVVRALGLNPIAVFRLVVLCAISAISRAGGWVFASCWTITNLVRKFDPDYQLLA